MEGESCIAEAMSNRCHAATPRHILILNWRDIMHPGAGGAEKVTHEIARRWVAWGHRVTLFCASFQGAPPEDVIDGVDIVRRGRQTTVHWEAYRHYRRYLQGKCDIVIDEVNTIPFFAPLYAQEPVIMYSNQLAREVWRYEAPFPLNTLGYLAEPLYMQTYRRTPIITISRSTEQDLRQLGLKGPYYVIPMSIDRKTPTELPPLGSKEAELTLVFVGRVVPSKRVDHIIRALGIMHASGLKQTRLWIIGSWDNQYRKELDELIIELRVGDSITFTGRVDSATRDNLLSRAHLFVMTSVREGWGLVVTEANALGTPAIVYDVPGLRDSTLDGETGVVCKPTTPAAFAQAVVTLHAKPDLYARMRERAWATASALSWDLTACSAWRAVEAHL